MWLLDANGTLTALLDYEPAVEVPGGEPGEVDIDAAEIVVRFGGTADGRGFSTGRLLRERGFSGRLLAAGPLIPDQVRHALQCGFDGILVTDESLARHGEGPWKSAIAHSVRDLYVADPTSRGPEHGIWAARHLN